MSVLSDREIAEFIRQGLDEDRLLAAHPPLTRARLAAFWRRLGLEESERGSEREREKHRPPSPSPSPSRPQRAGEHLAVVARCDGAARGNPGPAAVGVVIEDESGQALLDFGECIGKTTNNVAEYQAVIRAAERALELGATEVTFSLDSQLLARQLQGRYRVKAPHLKPLHARALQLLEQFERWQVIEVPREQNAAADRMANLALDKQRRGERTGDP